jgi:hypothetical protein
MREARPAADGVAQLLLGAQRVIHRLVQHLSDKKMVESTSAEAEHVMASPFPEGITLGGQLAAGHHDTICVPRFSTCVSA